MITLNEWREQLTKALNTIKPQPGWRKGVTAKRM